MGLLFCVVRLFSELIVLPPGTEGWLSMDWMGGRCSRWKSFDSTWNRDLQLAASVLGWRARWKVIWAGNFCQDPGGRRVLPPGTEIWPRRCCRDVDRARWKSFDSTWNRDLQLAASVQGWCSRWTAIWAGGLRPDSRWKAIWAGSFCQDPGLPQCPSTGNGRMAPYGLDGR